MTAFIGTTPTQIAVHLLELAATWGLQSSILLLTGLSAAMCLRRQGPALQSVVYRVTLCAVLLCPVAAQMMAASGISLLTIDVRSPVAVRQPAPLQPGDRVGALRGEATWVSSDSSDIADRSPVTAFLDEAATSSPRIPARSEATLDNQRPATSRSPSVASEPPIHSTGVQWLAAHSSLLSVGLFSVWIVGMIVGGAKLLFEFRGVESLRRRSEPADELVNRVCGEIAQLLRVRSPRVLSSPFLNSPCLLGHWRPMVLIPEDTEPRTYHQVFLHELAHLRRGDWLWGLVGRITLALFWIQPLLWLLVRRSATVAEEVCDDYVLQHNCDREGYLQHLVEIAERTLPQPMIVGVSMVGFRSKLGRRAIRILDTTRVLSTQAGRRFASLALATTLLVTVAVALLDIGQPRKAIAKDDATATEDSKSDQPAISDGIITVRGRVVDAEGAPVANARVHVAVDEGGKPATTSDADGHFSIQFEKTKFTEPDWDTEPWRRGRLCVTAPGFATSWIRGEQLARNPSPELRLIKDDILVAGQILDLEGQPIAGAKLDLWSISAPDNDDLDEAWPNMLEHLHLAENRIGRMRSLGIVHAGLVATRGRLEAAPNSARDSHRTVVVTDDQGRFELRGVGRDRIVRAQVSGPNIQTSRILIVTSPSIAEHWPPQDDRSDLQMMRDIGHAMPIFYPADFRHFAKPSRPITGVVRDAETGEPIAGIGVSGGVRGAGDHAYDTTDEDGQYTLTGLATEGRLRLYAVPRRASPGGRQSSPYIGVERAYFDFSTATPPQHTDFELLRGVLVRGTLLDDADQPVKARVEYLAHGENEFLQRMKDEPSPYEQVITDDDGGFELIVPPGPGALAVSTRLTSNPTVHYTKAKPTDFGLPTNEQGWITSVNEGLIRAENYEAATPIDFTRDDQPTIELRVKRLTDIALARFVDGEDRSVKSVDIAGRLPDQEQFGPYGFATPTVELIEVAKPGRRPIVIVDREAELAVALFAPDDKRTPHLSNFPKDEQGVYSIVLKRSASISGKLVGADGTPIKHAKVFVFLANESADFARFVRFPMVESTEDGSFIVNGLPPTGPFLVGVETDSHQGIVKTGIQLSPAQHVDSGTLDVSTAIVDPLRLQKALLPEDEQEARRREFGKTKGAVLESDGIARVPEAVSLTKAKRIRGQVIDGHERGVLATVHVVAKRTGMQTSPGSERILHQVTTDSQGRFDFEMELPKRDDSIDRSVWNASVVQLVATAMGYGPAATDLIGVRQGKAVTLQVAQDDVPITGQILDLEGQPVAGATIRVAILDPSRDIDKFLDVLRQQASREKPGELVSSFVPISDFLEPGFDRDNNERISASKLHFSQLSPNPVQTDSQGRFRLSGLGRDRLVALELSGPGIVKSWISVVSREMQPINASVFIGSRTRITFGSSFTYTAEPSQPIEGRITDIVTGEPIPGIRIQSEDYTTAFTSAVTGADGEYRLEGVPKRRRHRLTVLPRQDAAYFPRHYVELTEVADGLEPTRFDIQLRKAAWLEGRVLNKSTGKPVPARVLYSPHIANGHAERYPAFVKGRMSSDPFELGADSVATDGEGRFRVRVIPGDGMLFVRCAAPTFRIAVGSRALADNWFGTAYETQRLTNTYQPMSPDWVHCLQPISVPPEILERSGTVSNVEMLVDPGQTLDVRLIDPEGRPLTGVSIVGRLPVATPFGERPSDADRVTIPGVSAANPRAVFFYHKQRNLGACLLADQPQSEQHTVQLTSCGTLKGRLLGKDKQPLAEVSLGIHPIELGESKQHFPIARTDKSGRFSATRVIPNTKLNIYAMISPAGEQLGNTLLVKPGQTIDLGEMQLDIARRRRAID